MKRTPMPRQWGWGEQTGWCHRGCAFLVEFTPRRGAKVHTWLTGIRPGDDWSRMLNHARSDQLKREDTARFGSEGTEPKTDPGLLAKSAPILASYLTDTRWDDGAPRACCWLTIKTFQGMWRVELNDPNYARQLRLDCESWSGVFGALEAALASGKAPWMHAQWLERFVPKKPKKKS